MYWPPLPPASSNVMLAGRPGRGSRAMKCSLESHLRLRLTRRAPVTSGSASSRAHALGVGGDLRSYGARVAIMVMQRYNRSRTEPPRPPWSKRASGGWMLLSGARTNAGGNGTLPVRLAFLAAVRTSSRLCSRSTANMPTFVEENWQHAYLCGGETGCAGVHGCLGVLGCPSPYSFTMSSVPR